MTQKTQRIRYGVIGLGNIAQVAALPAFQHATENSELVALISNDADKRKELAAKWRIPHGGSYAEMDGVLERAGADAVYIALPNSMHRAFTEHAARRGLHVLCEKPMAMSSADCQAMISVCNESRVKLMIAYRLHFEAGNLSAIRAIEDGEIGQPRFFHAIYSQTVRPGDIRTRAEVGGGALFDLGIYCINAARYLFRDEPCEVLGWQVFRNGSTDEVDDSTIALLKFSGDRVATFTCSQSGSPVDFYRVVGTDGDLRVEPAFTYREPIEHHLIVDEKAKRKRFSKRDQFAAELIYFSDCIRNDVEPEPGGAEGLADVRIMEAIVSSAKRREPIELAPYERSRRPDLTQAIEKPPVKRPKPIRAPSPTF